MKDIEYAKSRLRIIEDFPKKGIGFIDICPVLEDPRAFRAVLDTMEKEAAGKGFTKVLALDARGFVFGAPLADRLGIGLVMARKPGKLPGSCISRSYDTEYNSNSIEIQSDALLPDDRVLIADDIIATGGSVAAARRLTASVCSTVSIMCFIDIIDIPKCEGLDYTAILKMKEKA